MLQKKVKVVLFGPMPNFSEIKQLEKANTEECSIEWFRPYPTSTYCLQSTSRDALIKSNTFLNNNAKRWASTHSNSFLFEPFDYLCRPNSRHCYNHIGKVVYMYDADHLNKFGGQLLFEPFFNYVKKNRILLNE